MRFVAIAALCCACLSCVLADVRLPALFSDGMVLQRNADLPVWGWAAPGEQVTVTLDQQKATATADNAGAWRVKLKPMKEGGPYELTVAGKNTLTVKDVLVGEVWICSGQSNMEWIVNGTKNAGAEIAAANYPQIRMFTVMKGIADAPRIDCIGKWAVCTPQTVGTYSAVGYFFARELYQNLNIPIGMIHTSWGGTVAEAWSSRTSLTTEPELKAFADNVDLATATYSQLIYDTYSSSLKSWLADAEKAKAEGKPIPTAPMYAASDPRFSPNFPFALYNAMIAPLIPYRIAGAIWYQGEANAGRAAQYRKLFPTMITGWRQAWGQGDFPFYFVQLANYMGVQTDPNEWAGWPELREAQTMTLALPNTGMATIIDIGEEKDIHPRNKQDVGRRLALNALAQTYGKDVVYSGPTFASMTVEDAKARIKFANLGGGLEVRGDKLKGFVICGEDKKFYFADAIVDGDTVVVSSAQVAKPVTVRYAFANNPVCNLYNKAGLPAVPFRTDAPK